MLRQYKAQRHRTITLRAANREKTIQAGTIALGTIVYLEPGNPSIVEAWIPREVGAAVMVGGKYQSRFMAGGHLAQVRSLRDGTVSRVSDRQLLRD
jgi:hypothetical protein